MPWKDVSLMDVRWTFIQACRVRGRRVTAVCEQFGISRKTGYKWLARYADAGQDGLEDASRRPHTFPTATDPALVALLCAARRQHPTWSARKLLAVLAPTHPEWAWPTRSTGGRLLRAHGLVRARRSPGRPRAPVSPLVAITQPNQTWTTDFKGDFRTGDGAPCVPFTLRDGWSRYVLRCDARPTKASLGARRSCELAFREYGLPERMRSDNGSPFAATGLTRLSYLSVWWIRLGIVPERIALGHPEQNGSHEQFHRVLKAETARPPAPTRAAQQQRFRRFCQEYNEVRPHEALADRPPASQYRPSRRSYPDRLPPLDYPGAYEVRTISPTGHVQWRGTRYFVAVPLAGERIAFEEIDEDVWTIWFATVRLARLDGRTQTVCALPLTPR